MRGAGWPGSRAAALSPGRPAPHHEAQLPRAKTALPSPQPGNEGEKILAAWQAVSYLAFVWLDKRKQPIPLLLSASESGFEASAKPNNSH